MNIAEEVDAVVSAAIGGMKGSYSNSEIRELVALKWPARLSRFQPTPCRIAKSMSRLGYEQWRDRMSRGWIL